MSIYDTGTASLTANGQVTGAGTQWAMPLTLIRVGATIVFKTDPVQIYTITEIASDTSLSVYNPNGETVPAGTGYAILAHDGITVQGLAQNVAETLRYYQSKETSIEGLLQFIGQDTFDWPRFEQLANQSITGAAEALASQVSAAESAATAVSARDTTTSARDATIEAINSAGDAGTLAYLASIGIGTTQGPVKTSLDWQTYDFIPGEAFAIEYEQMTNTPQGLVIGATGSRNIWIEVVALRRNSAYYLRVATRTGSNSLAIYYNVHISGSKGSREFAVREDLSLEVDTTSGVGVTSERVRGLLDVYSKSETFQKSLNFSDLTDKQLARQNLDVYSKAEVKFKTFSTVSLVTDSSVNEGDVIFIKNISSSADFGGGFFTVKKQRSLTPDGGLVINVGDSSQIFRDGFSGGMFKGPVDVKYFGAIPHSSSIDNSIAINLCLASPYVSECYVGDYYLVKNKIVMKTNKSIIGPSSSWAYSDSGFNMPGTIALADDHNLGYLDPILDFRFCRQTSISNVDVDGRGADVTCIEYGRRVDDDSTNESFNNHYRRNCTFRAARIGLRTDNAGLHRSYGDQITGCSEAGFYSSNNISDSTITSMYINEIGYHSGNDPEDPFETIGVGIRLGPHSGVAFVGGKIEYTRVHIQCHGASYTRFSDMWLDVAKRTAIAFRGAGDGSGTNNFINNCIITGGGYTSNDGGAITIDGQYGVIDLTITGGAIVASDEQINPEATTEPTYGAKLAGVKVGNNPNGVVIVNGVDMRKCSSQFGIYAYGGSKVVDRSISTKPNSLSGGSTVNGYSYDAGSEYRGLIIRDAGSDSAAASIGVPVGGFYRNNGSNLNIRVS